MEKYNMISIPVFAIGVYLIGGYGHTFLTPEYWSDNSEYKWIKPTLFILFGVLLVIISLYPRLSPFNVAEK